MMRRMRPEPSEPARAPARAPWVAGMMIGMIGGYFAIGHFNLDRRWYFDPSLPFEAHIPFVPAAIFAYVFVYIVLLTGFLIIPRAEMAYFRRAVLWLSLNLVIAWAIFLLVPVKAMHRPPIEPGSGLAMALTHWYYQHDPPTNLLPSLHVQMGAIGGLLCARRGGWLGVAGPVAAAVIAVSVLLVKQHYLADVVLALVIVGVTARVCRMGSFRAERDTAGRDPIEG